MSAPIVDLPAEGPEDDSSSIARASNSGVRLFEYSGWVFHLGVNTIGHEYCHLRYLYLRGKYVAMYTRDPHVERGIKPIRKGVISHNLMVEEMGHRKIDKGEVFVLKLCNRLDDTKKGEIACASAGDARKWVEAFEHGKQQAEYDILRGGSRHLLTSENELNLEGHRPRVRRYAYGLRKLTKIGKGLEVLLRQSSDIRNNVGMDSNLEEDVSDAAGGHSWRCVKITNGVRIFEDMRESKGKKNFLVKSVGVIDADVDTVFETILSVDGHKRYEWDTITGDLQLIDEVNGHFDIVYGKYDPKFLSRWRSKADFVFSRQWFRDQEGAYTILQIPTVHKKHPPTSHYRRIQINPSTWEIRRLNRKPSSSVSRCLVTQMVEIRPGFWDRWRKRFGSGFEKSMSFALLSQVAGLQEYFGANAELSLDSLSSYTHADSSDMQTGSPIFEESDIKDEFYDAIANSENLEDEDSDDEGESQGGASIRLRNISWAIANLALKRTAATKSELDTNISPITIDRNKFHGSLHQAKDEADTNCWACPSGQGFKIRGKTYLSDFTKVMGGEPLLKLVAVDWFKTENRVDGIALHPNSLVQSEAGKELPFIMAINLQVPAKPNYHLVLYYVAERPVNRESLLGRFVNGTDVFRNARFKLIPSIVEGYWMVKRAVGSKACLLGKAVTCKYIQQDNFLEVDVDIGSSSVARSIIGLVLGYVTGIVVDLAILVEAKEEKELPEYILGTVRLNRLKTETAVPL